MRVFVPGRGLVRLHLAEHPLDVAAGEVSENVDGVAAVVRQSGPRERGDMENVADVARFDHLPGLVEEGVPAPAAVDREPHVVLLADPHHVVGFTEAEGDRLLGPDGAHAGPRHVLHDPGAHPRRGADADQIELLAREHLPVVGVEVVVGQAPALSEDLPLAVVQVGPGDELYVRGGVVARRVTVGQEDRSALVDLVVERAAHASQAYDRRSVGCHVHLTPYSWPTARPDAVPDDVGERPEGSGDYRFGLVPLQAPGHRCDYSDSMRRTATRVRQGRRPFFRPNLYHSAPFVSGWWNTCPVDETPVVALGLFEPDHRGA